MQSTSRETSLLLMFVCLTVTVSVQQVQAQSITPNADAGSTVTSSGNKLDISGGKLSGDGANLFHSFKEFGLSQEQTANFLSHPSIQNVLARITGGNASFINGLIKVTGGNSNLYLMNPAGIVFGAHASLNVPAAFTATTANGIGFGSHWFSAAGSNDYAALVGNPSSFAFTMSQPGAIVNAGSLAVGPGQSLNLLGGAVINTGRLSAPGGQITVAAIPGSSVVRLSQPGQLLNLEVQPVASNSSQPNSWVLPALSLPELLTGGNLRQATGVKVNSNGTVELTSGTQVNADNGTTVVSGTLDASATVIGKTGGTVQVLGDRVKLIDLAQVDASGNVGAGKILIGGDYQGHGIVPHATQTFVGRDVNIKADTLSSGNGGQIIVWADEATRFYGNISARGGANTGNGGFVEVSGKEKLAFDGTVDLGAPAGKSGQLLLDPKSVVISNTTNDDFRLDAGNGQIQADDLPASTFQISANKIAQTLNSENVTIAATSNIDILDEIYANPSNTISHDLTLTAPLINLSNSITLKGGNISFNGPVVLNAFDPVINSSNSTVFDAGKITFSSTIDSLNTTRRNLTLTGGDVTVSGTIGGIKPLGRLDVKGNNISLKDYIGTRLTAIAAGNLSLNATGDLTLSSSQLLSGGDMQLRAQGPTGTIHLEDDSTNPLVLQSGGNLSIQGNQEVSIQALNNPQSVVRSDGNLSLVSDGKITGNGRFSSNGNFAVLNSLGGFGDFHYNPTSSNGIISSAGDVSFGNYKGVSLKVEAGGSISGGDVTITGPNTALKGTDSDIATLSSTPSLILRAGLTELRNSPNIPSGLIGGTTFSSTGVSSSGNITVGSITTAPSGSNGFPVDAVTLSATGSITVGASSASGISTTGSVKLSSVGDIKTGDISVNGDSSSIVRYPVALSSTKGSITTGDISVGGQNTFVSLTAAGNIEVSTIKNIAPAGSVDITAGGTFRATGTFDRTPQISDSPYSFPDKAALTAFFQQATGLTGTALESLVGSLTTADTNKFISILVNPARSFNAGSADSVQSGTTLLRIQHGGKFFVSGPIDTKNPVNLDKSQQPQYALINVNALPINASGTAGAIVFSRIDSTLVQSFPDRSFTPNTPASYARINSTYPVGGATVGNSTSGATGGATGNPTSGATGGATSETTSGASGSGASGASGSGISAQAASVVQQRLNTPTNNSACVPSDTNVVASVGTSLTSPEALKRNRASTPTVANPCKPSVTKGNTSQVIDNRPGRKRQGEKEKRLGLQSYPETNIIPTFSKSF